MGFKPYAKEYEQALSTLLLQILVPYQTSIFFRFHVAGLGGSMGKNCLIFFDLTSI